MTVARILHKPQLHDLTFKDRGFGQPQASLVQMGVFREGITGLTPSNEF